MIFLKRNVFGYIFYIFVTLLGLFILSFFNDTPSYERAFDFCRVITNHTYKDIYYGGLSNYLASYGWNLMIGIFLFAFSFPTMYFIDIYLFKSYFLQNTDIVNPKEPSKLHYILFFFIVIPLPSFLFNIYPLLDDNCEYIIKTVESFW